MVAYPVGGRLISFKLAIPGDKQNGGVAANWCSPHFLKTPTSPKKVSVHGWLG